MESILLGYGTSVKKVDIPKKNLFGCLRPKKIDCDLPADEIIKKALQNPIGTVRLKEMAAKGDQVAVIISISKPSFDVSENNIRIVLPVTEINKLNLTSDELFIYRLLKEEIELSRAEIDLKSGFEKSKTLRIVNSLVDKSIIQKMGNGAVVTYKLK